jgi:hypothetical protein
LIWMPGELRHCWLGAWRLPSWLVGCRKLGAQHALLLLDLIGVTLPLYVLPLLDPRCQLQHRSQPAQCPSRGSSVCGEWSWFSWSGHCCTSCVGMLAKASMQRGRGGCKH